MINNEIKTAGTEKTFAVHLPQGMRYFETRESAIEFAMENGREYVYYPTHARWVQIDQARYVFDKNTFNQ